MLRRLPNVGADRIFLGQRKPSITWFSLLRIHFHTRDGSRIEPSYSRVGLTDLQSPTEALTSTTQGRVYRITEFS